MFENDWILSSLSNPTLDIDDLVSIGGLNTKNTQFLSKDQYLKSNFIKDNALFKDTNGSFSREKFDKFTKYKHPDGEIFRIMNFLLEQNQMLLILQVIELMQRSKIVNLHQGQLIILIGYRLVWKVGEPLVRELNQNRSQLNLRKYSIRRLESMKILLLRIMPYLVIL